MSQPGSEPRLSDSEQTDRKQLEEKILQVLHLFLVELGSHRALRRLSLRAPLERELGLGSLERVELLSRLERDLSVRLPDHLLSEAERVSDLVRAVVAVRSQAAAPRPSSPLLQEIQAPGHRTQESKPALGGIEVWSQAGGWPSTLDDALFHFAHQDPQRVHIHLRLENGEMRSISYGELLSESRAVAAALLEREGLRPGQRVALMLPTGVDFFFAFFGIILAGGIPVPLYPPWRANRIEEYAQRQAQILRDAGARLLVTFHEVKQLMRLLQAQVPSLKGVLTLAGLGKASGDVKRPLPEDIALIQYTSGSTGDPKGVVLTHSNLVANIRAIATALDVNSRDVGVSWLPLYHDMGLIGAWLFCLYLGIPVVILSPQAFLSRPERWLWAIHHHRATLSAAPNFAYELCLRKVASQDLEGLDLSCWRAALNGAEPVHPDTLDGFCRRFQPYGFHVEALLPVYGLAEASVGVTIPPLGRRPRRDHVDRAVFESSGRADRSADRGAKTLSFVSAGKPLAGHQVRILNSQGDPVPQRIQGHIQCRGPSIMQGYFGQAEATAAALQDAWVNTGDLGYLADGELFVTGRLKDIIIKGGRNLYPQELEQIVGDVEGVRRGCVAAFGVAGNRLAGERLVVVAETRLTDAAERDRLASEIVARVDSQLGMPPDEVLLVSPQAVPKTSSGKIRRDGCRRLYLQGKLRSTSPPVWLQMARLIFRSLGQWSLSTTKRLGVWLYGGYVWTLLAGVMLPCWVLLLLVPGQHRTRVGPALLRFIGRVTLSLAGLKPVVAGLEHLPGRLGPAQGCLLIISNHASYLDILVLAAALPFDFSFVAKREAASWPFVGTFIRRSGYLTVDRDHAPRAVQDSHRIKEALLGGRPVHVFPEGTFTAASGLRPFQMGAFKLAAETGCPLVPVTLRGTRQALRDGCLLPSPVPIRVVISPPILSGGKGWQEAVRLRDLAYGELLKHCGEGPLDLVLAGPPKGAAE